MVWVSVNFDVAPAAAYIDLDLSDNMDLIYYVLNTAPNSRVASLFATIISHVANDGLTITLEGIAGSAGASLIMTVAVV